MMLDVFHHQKDALGLDFIDELKEHGFFKTPLHRMHSMDATHTSPGKVKHTAIAPTGGYVFFSLCRFCLSILFNCNVVRRDVICSGTMPSIGVHTPEFTNSIIDCISVEGFCSTPTVLYSLDPVFDLAVVDKPSCGPGKSHQDDLESSLFLLD